MFKGHKKSFSTLIDSIRCKRIFQFPHIYFQQVSIQFVPLYRTTVYTSNADIVKDGQQNIRIASIVSIPVFSNCIVSMGIQKPCTLWTYVNLAQVYIYTYIPKGKACKFASVCVHIAFVLRSVKLSGSLSRPPPAPLGWCAFKRGAESSKEGGLVRAAERLAASVSSCLPLRSTHVLVQYIYNCVGSAIDTYIYIEAYAVWVCGYEETRGHRSSEFRVVVAVVARTPIYLVPRY